MRWRTSPLSDISLPRSTSKDSRSHQKSSIKGVSYKAWNEPCQLRKNCSDQIPLELCQIERQHESASHLGVRFSIGSSAIREISQSIRIMLFKPIKDATDAWIFPAFEVPDTLKVSTIKALYSVCKVAAWWDVWSRDRAYDQAYKVRFLFTNRSIVDFPSCIVALSFFRESPSYLRRTLVNEAGT